MNITVIGMIKNSADIIETFIRANGLFADRFVLIDNDSTDNTKRILLQLIEEGYDIDLFADGENAYLQSMKMNVLIQRVISAYETDWIIPLDDDEILLSRDGRDVREVISGWQTSDAYYAKWRVYVPTEFDKTYQICIPDRLQYAFSDKYENLSKIVFSKDTASDAGFRIAQGNHDFIGPNVAKISQDDLFIAHYPVRSAEQIISKALVGWTNYLAMPYRKDDNGTHWQKIYDQCKDTFQVSIEQMQQICRLYIPDQDSGLEIEKLPLNLDEKAYTIKYTSRNEINPIRNYIENTESLAKAYERLLTEKMDG